MRNCARLLSVSLIFIAMTSPAFGQPQPHDLAAINFIVPPPEVTIADPETRIIIQFDTPLDADTVTPANIRVFGRWSGPASGDLQLNNGKRRIVFTPDEPFFAGERVTVNLSKNITASSALSLFGGFSWSFWIRTVPGDVNLGFVTTISTRLAGEDPVTSYGAYAGDLNNDGWSDLSVPNESSNDVRVFLNDGTGQYTNGFAIFPLPGGSSPSPNEGSDFNADGAIDFAVGNHGNDQVSLLLGDGAGGYLAEVNMTAASSIRGVDVLDANVDGHYDIITGNRFTNDVSLFLNDGTGSFASAVHFDAQTAEVTSAAAADINQDGKQDFCVGDSETGQVTVMIGDGNGGFTMASKASAGGFSRMLAVGDVNGDRLPDVVSANRSPDNAGVLLNDGQGGLLPAVTYPVGDFPIAIDLGDVDGDGDLEMVISNFSSATWTLYENDGAGNFFGQTTFFAIASGACAILHDRDNDGDLDMTGVDEAADMLIILENGIVVANTPVAAGRVDHRLMQNVPNPFNPVTTIAYELVRAERSTLNVYDTRGALIKNLHDGHQAVGFHQASWDGTNTLGQPVASGVYFYRLTTPSFQQTLKMVMVE